MKLIKSSFDIWEQLAGLQGIYKQIERAGKICYKSEHTIKDGSAKLFVDKLINMKHFSVLEHGTVYLTVSKEDARCNCSTIPEYFLTNNYTKVNENLDNETIYISTNYRVLVENNMLDYLQYISEPTEYHEKRITVHFVCDRGVSHEFVRHRVFSFAQESTRYCNYSKDKFGNELTFILPPWVGNKQKDMSLGKRDVCGNTYAEIRFREDLVKIEKAYFTLLKEGWKPQEARAILPNALKTELVMTGFVSDWKRFFSLRCPVDAHPQARELAIPLREEFLDRKYIYMLN